MPKANKPRHGASLSPDEARAFLGSQEIDPAMVMEAIHYSDGSLFLLIGPPETQHAVGVEFNPELAVAIVSALRALGVEVVRRP